MVLNNNYQQKLKKIFSSMDFSLIIPYESVLRAVTSLWDIANLEKNIAAKIYKDPDELNEKIKGMKQRRNSLIFTAAIWFSIVVVIAVFEVKVCNAYQKQLSSVMAQLEAQILNRLNPVDASTSQMYKNVIGLMMDNQILYIKSIVAQRLFKIVSSIVEYNMFILLKKHWINMSGDHQAFMLGVVFDNDNGIRDKAPKMHDSISSVLSHFMEMFLDFFTLIGHVYGTKDILKLLKRDLHVYFLVAISLSVLHSMLYISEKEVHRQLQESGAGLAGGEWSLKENISKIMSNKALLGHMRKRRLGFASNDYIEFVILRFRFSFIKAANIFLNKLSSIIAMFAGQKAVCNNLVDVTARTEVVECIAGFTNLAAMSMTLKNYIIGINNECEIVEEVVSKILKAENSIDRSHVKNHEFDISIKNDDGSVVFLKEMPELNKSKVIRLNAESGIGKSLIMNALWREICYYQCKKISIFDSIKLPKKTLSLSPHPPQIDEIPYMPSFHKDKKEVLDIDTVYMYIPDDFGIKGIELETYLSWDKFKRCMGNKLDNEIVNQVEAEYKNPKRKEHSDDKEQSMWDMVCEAIEKRAVGDSYDKEMINSDFKENVRKVTSYLLIAMKYRDIYDSLMSPCKNKSLGQSKILPIIGSMIALPECMVVDETLDGLDQAKVELIATVLKKCNPDISIIIAEHSRGKKKASDSKSRRKKASESDEQCGMFYEALQNVGFDCCTVQLDKKEQARSI